ncbi:helix-turn-helix transcriptional regulator [Mariniluteicoccus endophyticus]
MADVARTRALLRARDVMDRRYAEPLDLPALAAVVHLSPSQFLRAFAATFGETPHQYLYRRRIERAAVLLRTTDRPVTDIAYAVGYGSVGTFTRTFGRLMGRTPTAHRALGPLPPAPGCWVMAAGRPAAHAGPAAGSADADFGEAGAATGP